jgi:hypothetical protein
MNYFNYNLTPLYLRIRIISLDREELKGNVDYGAEKGHNQRIERSISKII